MITKYPQTVPFLKFIIFSLLCSGVNKRPPSATRNPKSLLPDRQQKVNHKKYH